MTRLATLLTATAITLAAPPTVASEVGTPDRAVNRQLTSFFQGLRALEAKPAGKVRISWWGDSAIVGDGYTGRLRERLQTRFGDGGPGFMLAASTFDGYRRRGVTMKLGDWKAHNVIQGALKSGLYGYGGVQASSFGGTTSSYTSLSPAIDEVFVFYRGFPKSGALDLLVGKGRSPTATVETEKESAVDDVWHHTLDKPADRIRVRAGGSGMGVVYGVALERKGAGVVLDALGVLGMRGRRWLNADADHIAGQIASRDPRLIVVNFGGNERVDPGLTEEGHRAEIAQVVRHLGGGHAGRSCLVVGPTAHGREVDGKLTRELDPRLELIYRAQRAAAEDAGCAFFDTIEHMGGDGALRRFRKERLIGGDLAHLNGKGHSVVGDMLADWLIGHYDAWKAGEGTAP